VHVVEAMANTSSVTTKSTMTTGGVTAAAAAALEDDDDDDDDEADLARMKGWSVACVAAATPERLAVGDI
jgi:hypothetical protein